MHAERQQSGQPPMAPEQARARLEEIAPCPAGEAPGTARALAAWLLVSAQRAWCRGLRPGGTDADISMAGGSFATAHALLASEWVSPDHADITAAEILAAIGADEAVGDWVAKHLRDLGIDPDEVTRLEAVLAGGESDRRIVSAPGAPDLVAVGNGPLLDPDCRDGKHTSCLGAPCECPVPGVHATKHEYERTQP